MKERTIKLLYKLRGLKAFYETIELTKNVTGFIEFFEGKALFFFAKSLPGEGDIVEIGSFVGKSTIWLAKAAKLKKNVKVYAIDPHIGDIYSERQKSVSRNFARGQEFEFRKNIAEAGVSDVVIPIVKTSQAASTDFNKQLRFLFIDGIHEYDFVKADFLCWSPKVISGGIIAFHDSDRYGVKRVLDECLYHSKEYTPLGTVNSITFFRKGKGKSLLCRMFDLRFSIIFPQYNKEKHQYGIMRLLLRILRFLVF